jgi:hypothetical protein
MEIVSRHVVMPSGVRYDLMTPAKWVRKRADLARRSVASRTYEAQGCSACR